MLVARCPADRGRHWPRNKGGASGLGLAAAKAFINAGLAGITLADLSQAALDKALAELPSAAHSIVHLVTGDVSEEEDNVRMVKETVDKFGKLDIAVLNAGISQPVVASVVDLDVAAWDKVMKVNTRGRE